MMFIVMINTKCHKIKMIKNEVSKYCIDQFVLRKREIDRKREREQIEQNISKYIKKNVIISL